MNDTLRIPLSDLKLLIKEVIRESLTDRTKSDYVGLPLKPIGKVPEKGKGEIKGSGLLKALKPKDKKVNEAGLTSEAGAEDPMSVLSQITANIGDDATIAKLNPEVAKKKLTVIRSILNSLVAKSQQGKQPTKQVAEGGPQYKVVAPKMATDVNDDKAREIQSDPKVNEASYKVVAPKASTDAKEDKARTIQTEPKVNETAYKTQGPSYKTFDDSPQLPDAVNDPENA